MHDGWQMTWTVPNILTVFRLLAAPFVGFAFVFFARPFADYLAFILFVGAAITDYLDGLLARRWHQISKFGRMLDPVADKAMVVIALAIVVGLSGLNPLVVLPATVILLREVFVSGLREFLGGSVTLHVTKLAKWKTTAQMIAIGLLLFLGVLETELQLAYHQMDPEEYEKVVTGTGTAENNVYFLSQAFNVLYFVGHFLLWIAAILTAITGWDYFVKSKPYLAETEEEDRTT